MVKSATSGGGGVHGQLAEVISIRDRRPVGPRAEDWSSKRDVAAHLKVHERTVERWMARGLPFDKPFESGPVRFKLSEVDAWMRGEA